jgi:hypothetical protein
MLGCCPFYGGFCKGQSNTLSAFLLTAVFDEQEAESSREQQAEIRR